MTQAEKYQRTMEVVTGIVAFQDCQNFETSRKVLVSVLACGVSHNFSSQFTTPPSGLRYTDDAQGFLAKQRVSCTALVRLSVWLESGTDDDWIDFVQTVLTHLVQCGHDPETLLD